MYRVIDLVQGWPTERQDQWIRQMGGAIPGFFQGFGWSRAQTLASRLTDPARVKGTLKALGLKSQEILRFVFAQGGHARRDELTLSFPNQQRAIDDMVQKGILFINEALQKRMGWTVYSFPSEMAHHLTKKDPSPSTLGALLFAQKDEILSLIAQRYALNQNLKNALDRVFAIKNILLDPERTSLILKELSAEEKGVLDCANASGGILRAEDVPALWRKASIFDPALFSQWDATPLHTLFRSALLFPDRLIRPTRFIVPSDIEVSIDRSLSVALEPVSPAGDVPLHLRSFGLRAWGDLRILKAALESGKMRVTQKGFPEKKPMTLLFESLGVRDAHYGEFLYSVGMLLFNNAGSPTARMKKMVEVWIENGDYQECYQSRSLSGRYLSEDLVLHRAMVLEDLSCLPVNQWVALPDFLKRVETTEWKRLDDPSDDYDFDYDQDEVNDNRKTLITLLVEPLVWLGLLEVGLRQEWTTSIDVSHIRLTRWGHFVLENTEGEFPELVAPVAESTFSVMPHLEITVPPGLAMPLLIELLKFSTLSGPHTCTLSMQSLSESFEKGFTSQKILDFLNKHSRTGVPESVSRLMADMDRRFGQIEVGFAGLYVRVKDPALLAGVANARGLAKFNPRPVGNSVMLFDTSDPFAVLSALRKLGHFPVFRDQDRNR